MAAHSPAVAQEKLTVWWTKGFYKSEDDALLAAVKKFERQAGVSVDLSQYPVQDMIPKTVSALDAGTPPDVGFADVYDFQVTGKWAFEGKLEDLSDVLTPIKEKFAPNTIETTYLLNDKAKHRAYYAFPLKQQTMHVQYWADMLGPRVSRNPTSPAPGRNTGRSGAIPCSRPTARRPASALTASASPWAWTRAIPIIPS
jgi:multiple sugar transport system substrate-binding protein